MMMDAAAAFAAHKINHLSASSLNLFAAAPAVWVLEKVLGKRSPVGAAAHRGTAVEDGITLGLNGAPLAECVAVALAKFDKLAALTGGPKKDKERAGIPAMVKNGLEELLAYGPMSSCQGKIEYRFDGLAVPMIGYYDYYWEDHGILIDLKTSFTVPSAIKTPHARQVALYGAALSDNLDLRLTYVSNKKAATYQLENARQHLDAMRNIALTVQRFLALSPDPQVLAGLVVPDVDSFYLSDPSARAEVFRQWGV
jgi:hypothetical protein